MSDKGAFPGALNSMVEATAFAAASASSGPTPAPTPAPVSVPPPVPNATKKSSGEKRKRQRRNNISWNDIKVVQNLIERCVQHHMTQAEIVTALKVRTYDEVCCDRASAKNYYVWLFSFRSFSCFFLSFPNILTLFLSSALSLFLNS